MLQLLRKRKRHISILVSMLLLTLTVGCELTNNQGGRSVKEKNNLNGEEIFRALYFGQGEVATIFPHYESIQEVNNMIEKSDQTETYQKARDLLVQTIRVQQPHFFTEFSKAMQSGDRVQIRRALNQATDNIVNAISIMTNQDFYAFLKTEKAQSIINEMNKNAEIKKIVHGTSGLSIANLKSIFPTSTKTSGNIAMKKKAIVTVTLAVAIAAVAVAIATVMWVTMNGSHKSLPEENANMTHLKSMELVNTIAVKLDKNIASGN